MREEQILTKGQELQYQIENLRIREEKGLINKEEVEQQLDNLQPEIRSWKSLVEKYYEHGPWTFIK